MHPQLAAIVQDLASGSERIQRITESYDEAAWALRPAPHSWSASECVTHLNLTASVYRDVLPEAIEAARQLGRPAPSRYRLDPAGWLIWKVSGPTPRFRVRTSPGFVPVDTPPRAELLTTFHRLQQEQVSWVEAADGLPIDQVKLRSPFSESIKYSVYSALTILAAHEHRHVGQAERALERGTR